jgi:K+-transporting ATPase c subunit
VRICLAGSGGGQAFGLYPGISLANALRQAPPPATCRNTDLVNQMARHAFRGILGTDNVNVLELNLALGQLPAQ